MTMKNRNYIIDALRGVSIILVVGIHYFDMLHFVYPDLYKSGGIINTVFGHGYYGVTIFFVISGYLITSTNVSSISTEKLFIRPGKFYYKRVTRIIPLLALTVLSSAVIISYVGISDWKPYIYTYQVGDAGYGPGFWSAIAFFYFNWLEIIWVPYNEGWFGLQWNILWSLAVEEQFYIIFPLMIAIAKTRFNVKNLAIFILVIALLLRSFLVINGYSSAVVYNNSICCFDALFVGVFIGLSKSSSLKVSKFIFIGGLLAFIITYAIPYFAFVGLPILGMVVTAGSIIHSSRAFQVSRPPRILNPLCELGSLSYGAYLLHPPALLIVFACMQIVGASAWMGFISCLVLTFLMAKTSFVIFEGPVERKLRSFLIGADRRQAEGVRSTDNKYLDV